MARLSPDSTELWYTYTIALNLKNTEVVRLATEVAKMANESKTEAIRRALLDRKRRLQVRRGDTDRQARLERLLRNRIWPKIPSKLVGTSISKRQREEILGYGPKGV